MQQKIHFDLNLPFRPHSSEIVFIPGLCDDGTALWFENNFEKLCEILDDAQSGYFNLVHLPSRIKKYLTSEYNSFYNPGKEPLPDDPTASVYDSIWSHLMPQESRPERCALICLEYDSEDDFRDKRNQYTFNCLQFTSDSDLGRLEEFRRFCGGLEYEAEFYSATIDVSDIDEKEEEVEVWDDSKSQLVKKLLCEVESRVSQLRAYGVDESIIRALFIPKRKLSRMVVTEEGRILLPDYDNMEIYMEPLPKALYILFLKHPEGISFKGLACYRRELESIYARITHRTDTFAAMSSIDRLLDPFDNSINEKCSRIRAAFISRFDDNIARKYYISGEQGEPKRIELDRSLVTWQDDRV